MSIRNPELFDLIEAYLDNQLDTKAKDDFEKKMIIDIALREEVEKHRLLHKAFTDMDSLEFRKKLIKIENDLKPVSKKEKHFIFNWKIAATVLTIVSLASLFIFQNLEKDQTLFEKYFMVYPLEDTTRGSQEKNVETALEQYAHGNYKEAITMLEKLVIKMPNAHQLKMYLGNAYLKTEKPNKALSEFKSLTTVPVLSEKAKWYMALCYLKTNANDKAFSLLEEIIAYDGIYKKDAENLYKDLLKKSNPEDF